MSLHREMPLLFPRDVSRRRGLLCDWVQRTGRGVTMSTPREFREFDAISTLQNPEPRPHYKSAREVVGSGLAGRDSAMRRVAGQRGPMTVTLRQVSVGTS